MVFGIEKTRTITSLGTSLATSLRPILVKMTGYYSFSWVRLWLKFNVSNFSIAHAVSLIIAPQDEGKGLGDEFNNIMDDKFNARLVQLIIALREHDKNQKYADALEQGRKSRNFLFTNS